MYFPTRCMGIVCAQVLRPASLPFSRPCPALPRHSPNAPRPAPGPRTPAEMKIGNLMISLAPASPARLPSRIKPPLLTIQRGCCRYDICSAFTAPIFECRYLKIYAEGCWSRKPHAYVGKPEMKRHALHFITAITLLITPGYASLFMQKVEAGGNTSGCLPRPEMISLADSRSRDLPAADYQFLAAALDGSAVTAVYEIDLSMSQGRLLMAEYEERGAGYFARALAGFIEEREGAYRPVLLDIQKVVENDYTGPTVTSHNTFYTDDWNGDGAREILEFSLLGRKQVLSAIHRYHEELGFFVARRTETTGGTRDPHTHKDRRVACITLSEYKNIRCKGPIRGGGYGWNGRKLRMARVLVDKTGGIQHLPPNASRMADGVWDVTRHYRGLLGQERAWDIRKVIYEKKGREKGNTYRMELATLKGALPVSFRAPRL